MRKNEKITALYERLSRDDFGKDDPDSKKFRTSSKEALSLIHIF